MGVGLKTLSTKEVLAILLRFGFVVHGQKGSHIKLRRTTFAAVETLMIPERKEIPKGTLRAIFTQASVCVSQNELRPYFYNN